MINPSAHCYHFRRNCGVPFGGPACRATPAAARGVGVPPGPLSATLFRLRYSKWSHSHVLDVKSAMCGTCLVTLVTLSVTVATVPAAAERNAGEQGAFSATTPLRVALFTASTTMVSHSSRIFHHTAPFPLLHLLEHITPPRAPFRRHTPDSLQWLPANPAWCCRCLSAPELLEISTTCPRFSRSPPLIPHPPVREMSRARVTHA